MESAASRVPPSTNNSGTESFARRSLHETGLRTTKKLFHGKTVAPADTQDSAVMRRAFSAFWKKCAEVALESGKKELCWALQCSVVGVAAALSAYNVITCLAVKQMVCGEDTPRFGRDEYYSASITTFWDRWGEGDCSEIYNVLASTLHCSAMGFLTCALITSCALSVRKIQGALALMKRLESQPSHNGTSSFESTLL